MKGELQIDLISRSKVSSSDPAPSICITGLIKPSNGAEQRVEMFLSAETWEALEKHVAWDHVVRAMSIIRDGMMAPKPARIAYTCPSCGEQRQGPMVPEEPAIALAVAHTNGVHLEKAE